MKYFKNVETLEELKSQYKKLAMKNHPDKGGDTATMQQINSEYEELFERVKNKHKNHKGEAYEKATQETPAEFQDLMTILFRMQGLTVEIIGSFVWVGGNTKENKEELKKLGFKWHSKKFLWYKAPDDYHKTDKKQYSMDEIRDMFGSIKPGKPIERKAIAAQ